ncbi:hypothetical protein CYMTET_39991 [Cymbomonas tetramitiformis]|uniref:Amino acid transporter transmembrane domain-containing protein n=1 Tax=Cymbomonas tetramitiformis TaxID=36881 RepID=A0AAE0CA66_9CHLO|nr:hypothetical protein CYMTET_39991 [Cymbomonas tetramitiformis]|eukprot:gene20246-24243_t
MKTTAQISVASPGIEKYQNHRRESNKPAIRQRINGISSTHCSAVFSSKSALRSETARPTEPVASRFIRSSRLKCEATSDAAVPAPAKEGISESAAVANVIKGIMGAGCFALPWAYAKTGIIFTTAYMIAANILCLYCVSLMTRAKNIVLEKDPSLISTFDNYSGVAMATIGPVGGVLTQAMVVTCCFGIASAYLVFVASTMLTVLPASMELTQNYLVKVITVIMVFLSWLRNFSGVSLISLMGNIAVCVGMLCVLVYASALPPQLASIPMMNLDGFGQAFGSVAFLFFVHFTMPPVEASMAEPDKFFNACVKAFGFSTLVSAIFGTVGAIYFGPGVSEVVIGMMSGAFVVSGVKLLLCFNLLCTFPLVCRGAFGVLENFMGSMAQSNVAVLAMRTTYVILAATAAICIPSFGKLLGLVGGVSCTCLTMVFPPLMLLLAARREGKSVSLLETLLLAAIIISGLGIAYYSVVA